MTQTFSNPDCTLDRSGKVFSKVCLPEFYNWDTPGLHKSCFFLVFLMGSLLTGVLGTIWIGPWVSMPEGSVHFQGDPQRGEVEIGKGTESSPVIPENLLVNEGNSEIFQFLFDCELQFRDPGDSTFSDGLGGSFRQFPFGLFCVPIPTFSGSAGVLLSDTFSHSFPGVFRNVVGAGYCPADNPFPPCRIVALGGTQERIGFRVGLNRRRSGNWYTADCTGFRLRSGQFVPSPDVGTSAGAGRLSAVFQARRISRIGCTTDRTFSFNHEEPPDGNGEQRKP